MAPTTTRTAGLTIVETSYVAQPGVEPFYEITATDRQDDRHVFVTRDLLVWDTAVTFWESGSLVTISSHEGTRVRRVAKRPDETLKVQVATAITVDVPAAVSA